MPETIKNMSANVHFVKQIVRCVVICFVLQSIGGAYAQKMPEKIKLVVAWQSGDAHNFALKFAPMFSKHIGVPVEVSADGGKFGQVGIDKVFTAVPDGSTLLFGTSSDLIYRLIDTPNAPIRWDAMEVIDLVAYQPLGCILSPGSHYKNIHEVVAAIKSKKHSIKLLGATRFGILFSSYVLRQMGLSLSDVTYKQYKGKPLTVAILEEPNLMTCTAVNTIIQQYNTSEYIHLITNSIVPIPAVPNLIPARQVGAKSIEAFRYWSMLIAPPRTSKEIQTKYRAALNRMSNDPEWIKILNDMNASSANRKVPDIQKFLNEEWMFFEKIAILTKWVG